MDLIAAARIPSARARAAGARPYTERLEQLAADLAASPGQGDNPLLGHAAPDASTALIVVAGDRGLSGPYNGQVLRLAETVVRDYGSAKLSVTVVGRRAQSYMRFRGVDVDSGLLGVMDKPTYDHAAKVAAPILEGIHEGGVERVDIVSTRYLSAARQEPQSRQLLPLGPDLAEQGRPFDYELEPERDEMLRLLVPQLLKDRTYLALLEASVSEHVARQRAMKSATDNADDLTTTLSRVMNRVRQDSITTEIMDIVGGAEALRSGAGAKLPELHVVPGASRDETDPQKTIQETPQEQTR